MFRGDFLPAILALFSTFTVVLCMWSPKNPQAQPVCTSTVCAARGQEYIANMLRTADPCQDFYSFACGSWEKNHPTPPYSDWDVAHQMDENTLAILRKLLDAMPPHNAQSDCKYAKLKWTYDACMKIPYYGKFGPKEIADQIRRIGRHPTKRIWDLHNEYLQLTGESALFDLDVGSFDHDIDSPMLQFAEPVSAYGSVFHDEKWKSSDEKSYSQALFEMLSSLGLPDPPDVIKRRIKSVIQFRNSLNKIVSKIFNSDDDEDEESQMSPRNLESLFARSAGSNRANAYKLQIPWEKIVKILLKDAVGPLTLQSDIVVLHSSDYFIELAALLTKSTEQDIADHMEVYFVERHLKRTEKVKQLLKNSWQDPPPATKTVRFDEPRWMTCIKECNLESTLAKLFVNKWLKTEHKDQVGTIMTGLKKAINAQMTKSTWLDSESRILTTKRMDAIEGTVAECPKRLRSYSPTRAIFPTAFLDTTSDVLFVHAAMLQSPVFDHRMPAMYNLATTGFMLGHEYYHVIDDCGTYRKSADRKVHLWPEPMRKKCKDYKQCFITEYNKFTKTEFQRRYKVSPKRIDTTVSFIENYPDVMGLEAALMLHEKLKEKNGGKCEILPGFQGYSCDQMFFVALANMWCGMPPAKDAVANLPEELHSINPVRVNGALSSTEAFAKAFQCGPRDPMNPSTRCNLWK